MKKYFMIALMLMTFFVGMSYAAGSFSVGSGTSLYGSVMIGASAGGECAGYLICQNFEGTGYDNGETWTETLNGGTVDEDYTTAPLRGSQSLYLYQPNDAGWTYTVSPSGLDQSTVYGFVKLQFKTAWPTYNQNILALVNISSSGVFFLYEISGGYLGIQHGSVSSESASPILSLDNTYYIWFDYSKGTGSNGIANIYVSTTTTKPGSPDLTIPNGDATTNVDACWLITGYSASGGYVLFDQAYLDDVNIGDVSP